ncbi:MAG TPA: HAMP domain-containing sensor histidine kinase [bacterium]|nr:HAMP domain-containing sensor histidine kinase [bacterium]
MRLKTQFSLSYALVLALSLVACLGLFQEGVHWMLGRQEAERQAQRLADYGQSAQESIYSHEQLGLIHAMNGMLKDPSLVFAAFGSRAMHMTFPPGYASAAWVGGPPPAAQPLHRVLANGAAVEDWVHPLPGGAWVELAYSTTSVERLLKQQGRAWVKLSLGLLAAGLLPGLLLGWFLARRLAHPLQAIAEGTLQVRAGTLNGLVEIDRDDEIGDLARSFNGMVLQLKELEEMKRDFVAGVTHDFGGPLHAIRSTVDVLLSGDAGPVDELHSEHLLMISNNLASLTAFVNNLLTVARIEAAKMEPFFEPVDVQAQMDELMKLYQAQATQKGLTLQLLRKSAFVSLDGDLTMFRQIVMNLLSNALKFTDQGGVEVSIAEEDGDFVLQVKDTGLGIEPRFHALVFDRFFRVRQDDKAPQRQGSGLGLAIVKGLVQAHGGKVSVDSRLGQGATFTVRLPKQHSPQHARSQT